MSASVTPETCPSELHLSDCAITTKGFNLLMTAIKETECYPYTHPRNGNKKPLYLRLENNYIKEAAIQEKVDSGLIQLIKKGQRTTNSELAKVNLVHGNRGFQQKKQDGLAG